MQTGSYGSSTHSNFREHFVVALSLSGSRPSNYYWPANHPSTRQALQRIFLQHGSGEEETPPAAHTPTPIRLPVRMGRFVHVPKSNQNCAWFDFDDLCHQPLGAADYLSICERYKTLIVDHVPQLDGSKFNEARRFVTLIDAVYESKTRLVLASNHVPLDELLVGFDATVESNDGDEEIAVDGMGVLPDQITTTSSPDQHEIFVKGEGGSSSSRYCDRMVCHWSDRGVVGTVVSGEGCRIFLSTSGIRVGRNQQWTLGPMMMNPCGVGVWKGSHVALY